MTLASHVLRVGASLLLTAACTGQIEGGTGGADGTPASGLTPGGGQSPGAKPLDCSTTKVAFAPLRRLTREHYDNAIRDLLAIQGEPALGLSPDEKMAAFFSNAVSPVTRLSVEQYADVAEDLATAAVGKLGELLVCERSALGDAACAGQFITTFGLRAFRRPLTAIEVELYQGLFEDASVRGFEQGIRIVLQAMLQSPHFLYHLELTPAPAGAGVTPLDGYQVAARLSFALWNTTPDAELLAAAAAGQLLTPDGILKQASRLLLAERARDALSSFHVQWLGLATCTTGSASTASSITC